MEIKVRNMIYSQILSTYIRAKTTIVMAAFSELCLQKEKSSHALILSNAYNKNTDFNSVNSEENLFRVTNPKLSAESKCSE